MPAEQVRSPDHRRDRSLGWLGVRWIEHFCVHGPGDIQGTPLRGAGAIPLSTELAALTVDAYALDRDGRRLYDSVFFSRPKGADKSGHAARIGLFETLGPCRFGGWARGGEVYEQMDFRHVFGPGEPLGRPLTYPFWRVMATEEGQTGNVYDAVYYNLVEGPLREAFAKRDDVGLTRTYLPGGGEIRPSTASSAAKDGGKESHTTWDETHLYVLPELRRMYDTVRRNLRKRLAAEGWSNETSTMYEPGMDSIAERTHSLAKAIRSGKARSARLLFDHREAPANVDLADDVALAAALREAYGDAASYMDIAGLVAHIRDPRNDLQDSIRYFLNQATAGAERWLAVELWDQRADLEHRVPRRAPITLGFDGSTTRDATALVATEALTGFQWPIGIWERPERATQWEVPYEDVDAAVDAAFASYRVLRMYCDPRWWETRISGWAGRYGDRVVVEWPTNRPRPMAAALLAYRNAIVAGEQSHNGDPVLRQHVANAVRHREAFLDEFGNPMVTVRKESHDSPNKIDALMAGDLSWEARRDALAAGEVKGRRKPRYFSPATLAEQPRRAPPGDELARALEQLAAALR